MIDRLTGSLDFQGQALLLRAERQRLVASNIANADTPGYRARDFDFATALREATAAVPRGAAGAGELGAPVARGLLAEGFGRERPAPVLRWGTNAHTNLDDNGVDMDRERAAFAENALKYEATLRFVNGSVRTMLDAMKSHHQG